MRYLVFDTEAEATAAVASIDDKARIVFAARGYTVTEDGAIVGKRASDGEDVPTSITTTWDVPRQRLGGKWCVAHPESHPSGSVEVSPGVTVEMFVMSDIGSPVIEDYTADWFPSEDD